MFHNIKKNTTLQAIINKLQNYWFKRGCIILQPIDTEVGAGTLNPHTFFKILGLRSWNGVYVERCRRPSDGRYGKNPNKTQSYFQLQVILKPCPGNIQELYLESLKDIGIILHNTDLRFIEDDWEHPALGACGLGWEVRLCGLEITQITYLQRCGTLNLDITSCEITYGLERITSYLQNINNYLNIIWSITPSGKKVRYFEIYEEEYVYSYYNFHFVNTSFYFKQFECYYKDALKLLDKKILIPSYEKILKCSHILNILDARGSIGLIEKMSYIQKLRNLSKLCAKMYVNKNNF